MPPTDVSVELTKAIIAALPAAALAVLFAIFAVVVILIFIRQINASNTQFAATIISEGERWRQAHSDQGQRWRDDFKDGMTRFANEMGQVNANVLTLTQSVSAHDKTMQIGIAGLTNAIQVVSKTATGPLMEKK